MDESKEILSLAKSFFDGLEQGDISILRRVYASDVEIWHNKVRIDNPLLCDGDGPIYQNRQWHEQFYMDAAGVPAELRARRLFEIDKGVDAKPDIRHAFDC